MTLATAVVLILAVGAIIHRSGGGSGDGPGYVAKSDNFILRAGRTQRLDVLLNDSNQNKIDPTRLTIISLPTCGTAEVVGSEIVYSASDACEGTVTMSYCVPFEDACDSIGITLNVLNLGTTETPVASIPQSETVLPVTPVSTPVPPPVAKPETTVTATADTSTAPSVLDRVAQGEAPAQLPQVAMGPARLDAPNASEIITPSDAASNLRLEHRSVQNVEVTDTLDSELATADGSALTGPVSVRGLEMTSPQASETGAGVVVASAGAAPTPLGQPGSMIPSADQALVSTEASPDALIQTPTQDMAPIAEPEATSGVLASLARSNAFLGATMSAARSLLAPDTDVSVLATSNLDAAARPEQSVTVVAATVPSLGANETTANLPLPGIEPKFVIAPRPGFAPTPSQADAFSAQPNPPEPAAVVAALAPVTAVPAAASVAPPVAATGSACEPSLLLRAQSGAEVLVMLTAPCHPNQIFTATHSAISFAAITNAQGSLEFTVPAMSRRASIGVVFVDGTSASGTVDVPDVDRFTRVAVAWESSADIDLHAIEFGAATDSEGHIWSGNPRNYRLSRRSGGGYLTILGLDDENSATAKTEIYTLPQSSQASRDGLVALSIEVVDRGNACDSKILVRSSRSENAELSIDRDIQLALGACDGTAQVIVSNAIRDIRVGRN